MRNNILKTLLVLLAIGSIALIAVLTYSKNIIPHKSSAPDSNIDNTFKNPDFDSFVASNRKFYFNQDEYDYRH